VPAGAAGLAAGVDGTDLEQRAARRSRPRRCPRRRSRTAPVEIPLRAVRVVVVTVPAEVDRLETAIAPPAPPAAVVPPAGAADGLERAGRERAGARDR
jgi:hypothetical protein